MPPFALWLLIQSENVSCSVLLGQVRGWVGAGGVGSQTLDAWSGFSLGTENPGHVGARTK